jgi:hypothetical protein
MDSKVKGSFWTDPEVEDLGAEEKLAVLWLMTAHVNACGWTEVGKKRFEFETGCPWDALGRACDALQGGIVRTGNGTGFWLRNYIRHQFGNGEKLVKNRISGALVNQILDLPEEVMEVAWKAYPELKKKHRQSTNGRSPSKGSASPTDGVREGEGERVREGEGAVELHWDRNRGWSGVTGALVEELQAAYPACDIDRQLRAMDQWLKSNREKSHKSNWRRFLTNWLAKEQDRGGDLRGAGNAKKENGAGVDAFAGTLGHSR